MQSLLIRRGAVAATVTALLFTVAAAQDKPSRPKIQDRDPFINQQSKSTVSTPSQHHVVTPPVRDERQHDVSEKPTMTTEKSAVSAPLVKVTGIIESQGKKSAILNNGKASRIVAVGERVADYQVTSISNDRVVFTYSGQKFEVPMESQF